MNYSVEYFTLPLTKRPLTYNDLADFDRVKVLNITHNVLFDHDCVGHFACMKSLKAFRVTLPCTMYYVRDGVLYSKDDLYKNYFKKLGFTIQDDEEILIEVPPAYPGDTFVVPEGVAAIYHGAFNGTSFKSITLPHSLKVVGFYALVEISGLEYINVPNKDVHLYDQKRYDTPITIKNNSSELDEKLREYWELYLNPLEVSNFISEFGSSNSNKYVYPLDGMRELIESLSTKESVLESLETIDKKYPNHAEFMRAMILLHTDVTLLHSNSDDEAIRIIRNIWGDEQSAKNSILEHVNLESITHREDLSDFEDLIDIDELDESSWGVEEFLEYGEYDFKTYSIDDDYPTATSIFFGTDDLNHELFISAQLATSAPMLFLDTLGGKFMRDNVLIPHAIDILKTLSNNGDEFAIANLSCINV